MAKQRQSVLPGYYSSLPKGSKISYGKTYNKKPLPMAQEGGWSIGGWEVPSWLKTTVQVLDPTGVSSWGDAGRAIKTAWDDPNLGTIGNALVETVGAVPIVGKVGKAAKVAKQVSKAGKGTKTVGAAGRAAKILKGTKNVAVKGYKTAESLLTPIAKIDRAGSKIVQKVAPRVHAKVEKAVVNVPKKLTTKYPRLPKVSRTLNRGSRFWKAEDEIERALLSDSEAENIVNQQEKSVSDPNSTRYENENIQQDMKTIDSMMNELNINESDFENPKQYGGFYQYGGGFDPSEMYYYASGGIPNNPGFNALPDYVQEKIINNLRYGGMYQVGGEYGDENMYYTPDEEEMYYPADQQSYFPSEEEMIPGAAFGSREMMASTPLSTVAPTAASAAPVSTTPVTPEPAVSSTPSSFNLKPYEGISIVDFLASQGLPYDYSSRRQLAKTLAIPNYRGTSSQNLQMISLIQSNPNILSSYTAAPSVGGSQGMTGGGGGRTGGGRRTGRSTSPQDQGYQLSEEEMQELMAAENDRIGMENPYISINPATGLPYAAGTPQQGAQPTFKEAMGYMANLQGSAPQRSGKKIPIKALNMGASGIPYSAEILKRGIESIKSPYAGIPPIYVEQEPRGFLGAPRTYPTSKVGSGSSGRTIYVEPRASKALPAPSRGLPASTSKAQDVVKGIVGKGYYTKQDVVKLKELNMKQSSIDRILQRFPKDKPAVGKSDIIRLGARVAKDRKTRKTVKAGLKAAKNVLKLFEEGGDYSGTWSGNTYYDIGGGFPYGGVVNPYDLPPGASLPQYQMGSFYQQGGFYEEDLAEDEMYVTPEQMEMLRQQGYDFDVIS